MRVVLPKQLWSIYLRVQARSHSYRKSIGREYENSKHTVESDCSWHVRGDGHHLGRKQDGSKERPGLHRSKCSCPSAGTRGRPEPFRPDWSYTWADSADRVVKWW